MLTVSSTRVKNDTEWINNTWDGSHEMMEGMLTSTHEAPDKQSYMVFDGTKPQRHRIHQRLQSKFRHISYPVKGTEECQSLEKIIGDASDDDYLRQRSTVHKHSRRYCIDRHEGHRDCLPISREISRCRCRDQNIGTSYKKEGKTPRQIRETEPYYYKTITGENVWKPVDKITTNNPQRDIVRPGNDDSTCACS